MSEWNTARERTYEDGWRNPVATHTFIWGSFQRARSRRSRRRADTILGGLRSQAAARSKRMQKRNQTACDTVAVLRLG